MECARCAAGPSATVTTGHSCRRWEPFTLGATSGWACSAPPRESKRVNGTIYARGDDRLRRRRRLSRPTFRSAMRSRCSSAAKTRSDSLRKCVAMISRPRRSRGSKSGARGGWAELAAAKCQASQRQCGSRSSSICANASPAATPSGPFVKPSRRFEYPWKSMT